MTRGSARPLSSHSALPEPKGQWPFDASDEPVYSIGEVVSMVSAEFPTLTQSKLRFLGEKGIVTPHRTGARYRRYSQTDVARIRYTLAAQRDSFMPLKEILNRLHELDAGRPAEVPRVARVVASGGELVRPNPDDSISVRDVAELTGATEAEVEAILAARLLEPDRRGRLQGRSVEIVQQLLLLGRYGIEPRHLLPLRKSAEHAAETIERAVAPITAHNSGAGRERGRARGAEMAEVFAALFAALVRAETDH